MPSARVVDHRDGALLRVLGAVLLAGAMTLRYWNGRRHRP